MLAALALCAGLADSPGPPVLPLQPRSYPSPDGSSVLHVDPSHRHGAGPALYTLERDGLVLWSREHPFTFRLVTLNDDGNAFGYGFQKGDGPRRELVLAALTPLGDASWVRRQGALAPGLLPGDFIVGWRMESKPDQIVVEFRGGNGKRRQLAFDLHTGNDRSLSPLHPVDATRELAYFETTPRSTPIENVPVLQLERIVRIPLPAPPAAGAWKPPVVFLGDERLLLRTDEARSPVRAFDLLPDCLVPGTAPEQLIEPLGRRQRLSPAGGQAYWRLRYAHVERHELGQRRRTRKLERRPDGRWFARRRALEAIAVAADGTLGVVDSEGLSLFSEDGEPIRFIPLPDISAIVLALDDTWAALGRYRSVLLVRDDAPWGRLDVPDGVLGLHLTNGGELVVVTWQALEGYRLP